MNNTIPVTTIIAKLALRENLKEEEARLFVNTFFSLIEESLKNGEAVEINELGEFKIKDDTAVFVPSDAFKADTNAPFAMFAPYPLDDDIDAELIGMPESVEEPPVTQDETQNAEPVVVDKVHEEVVVREEVTVHEPEKSPTIVPQEVYTPESETDDTLPAYDEPVPQEETPYSAPQEEPIHESTNDESHHYIEYQPRYRTNRCCIALWALAGLIVGLLVGLAAGYIGRDKITILLADNTVEPMAAVTTDTLATEVQTTLSVDTVAVEPKTAATDSVPAEIQYDQIGPRRYLTTMAREHYGNQDYWVYIYKENSAKLRHPDRIAPGTKVVIPPFDKYRTSANEETNLDDARREALRIYSKYD